MSAGQFETRISVDRVLRRWLEVYKNHLGRLLGMAAILFVGGFLTGIVIAGIGAGLGALLGSAAGGLIVGGAIAIAILLVASATYTGSVVRLVEADERGLEMAPIIDTFKALQPRVWPLVWVPLVGAIAIFFGFLAFIVPGVWLLVIWVVVTPVIVIEGLSFDAFGRSKELVKGNGWSIFGMGLVVMAVYIGVSVVTAIVQAVAGNAVGGILNTVLSILLIPAVGVLTALLYFELRRFEDSKPQVAPTLHQPPPPPAAPAPPQAGAIEPPTQATPSDLPDGPEPPAPEPPPPGPGQPSP